MIDSGIIKHNLLIIKASNSEELTSTSSNFSGDISSVLLVYGQMNEMLDCRMRVSYAALSIAEFFREIFKQDILIFTDNVFRFLQAGSEVSTLLSRMPSAVGYQPTLSTEISTF